MSDSADEMNADVPAVCSSTCQLSHQREGERQPLGLVCVNAHYMERMLPLLACFEPDSLRGLCVRFPTVHVCTIRVRISQRGRGPHWVQLVR